MANQNHLRSGLLSLVGSVKSNVDSFHKNLQEKFQTVQEQADRTVKKFQLQVSEHLSGSGNPVLASISSHVASYSSSRSKTLPVFEVGFNPEELKYRLQAVPVFTVVNNRNEFVLISGEGHKQQLGLFFFNEEDADAMIDTLRKQDPKLGKQAKVLPTSMDRIYELATTPREAAGLEGVAFRFVPDAIQVEKALQLYTQAGVPAAAFQGVPLFQAEGLTVKAEQQRFTPLFFSKDDLDSALGNAQLTKDSEQVIDTRSKVARARAELDAANTEVSTAGDKERKGAQRKVDAAMKRLERYQQRLDELQKKKKQPRIDVGSLEEVIAKMELDEKGEWGDVVFIPPGSLSTQPQEMPAGAPAK